MRLFGRRLQFQLTPLLDLLLIVIFAQYLEVRQQATRETTRAERRIADRERELEDRSDEMARELAAARRRSDEAAREAARQRSGIEAENAELRNRVDDVLAQQRRAADLVAELFAVPPELVDEALRPLPPGAPQRSPADAERLRERFRELAEMRGPQVVEHLFSYDELRKRADVWTLRIRENGELVLSTGGATQSFRAAIPEEFAGRLFDRYKTLPQPKGLVVLLVSYGDARADVRQAVLTGLPEAVRRMREDSLGRTQFEYAVLGFVPEEAGG